MARSGNSNEDHITRLVDNESYNIWKFEIKIILKAKGLFEIIASNNELKKDGDWERKDAQAQAIIITSIDKKHVQHLLNCENAKDMFDNLCSLYDGSEERNKCQILQEFFNYKYRPSHNINEYLSEIENLTFRLKKNLDKNWMTKL
ncbi:uncharacterized protein LOC131848536 [Achroia grisella]|uniref:uncharacterized protein LOC131848536 n=1 Tax=Achroia grisella TaxID=688607 RepID=UPI0027D2B30B|nr:uncharacterized protein LOC131848536 [Achroia grisella]